MINDACHMGLFTCFPGSRSTTVERIVTAASRLALRRKIGATHFRSPGVNRNAPLPIWKPSWRSFKHATIGNRMKGNLLASVSLSCRREADLQGCKQTHASGIYYTITLRTKESWTHKNTCIKTVFRIEFLSHAFVNGLLTLFRFIVRRSNWAFNASEHACETQKVLRWSKPRWSVESRQWQVRQIRSRYFEIVLISKRFYVLFAFWFFFKLWKVHKHLNY